MDLIVSVLRFDGEVPSIRRKVLEVQGMDYERALEDPTYRRALDEATHVARELIRTALEGGDVEGKVRDLLDVAREERIAGLLDVVKFGLKLVPKVRAVSREIPQLLRGFEKEFIEPGPSGNVTRGRTEVLPTGRNFYTVAPWRVPTRAARNIPGHPPPHIRTSGRCRSDGDGPARAARGELPQEARGGDAGEGGRGIRQMSDLLRPSWHLRGRRELGCGSFGLGGP